MALDFGRLLLTLRERPYDEMRYRWERKARVHVITAVMSGEKASVMISEEFAVRLRGEVVEQAVLRFDQELWDQLTDEARR